LWLQPAGAAQRHDHASPCRLRVLSCRRHFPDSRTGPTFWRPDTHPKRTDDKRLKPLGEVRRVKGTRIDWSLILACFSIAYGTRKTLKIHALQVLGARLSRAKVERHLFNCASEILR